MDRKLIEYLPPIVQEYEEIQQICNAEQSIKEKIWAETDKMYADYHLSTQSAYMATLWEKTLGITPLNTDTIEVRNARIKGKIQESLPYTLRSFKRLLVSLVGDEQQCDLEVDYKNLIITIRLRSDSQELIGEILNIMDSIVPAHYIFNTLHIYNTHAELSKYPHYVLSQFTHKEIKEDVVSNYLSTSIDVVENQNVEFLGKITVSNIENVGFRKR